MLQTALFAFSVLLLSTHTFAAAPRHQRLLTFRPACEAHHPSHGRPQGPRPEDGHQGGVGRAQARRAEHGTGWATKTGKEWDATTGLYDFGARQYDPRLGQWLSPDPILASYVRGGPNGGVYWPANLNGYGYVANNPLKYVDQDGRFPVAILLIAGATGLVGAGFDALSQYLDARNAQTEFEYDYGRGGIAFGFGAVAGLSGGAAAAGASVGRMIFLGGVFGMGVGGSQEVAMQAYRGNGYDPQAIAQAAAYSGMGGVVGGAAGIGLGAALASRFAHASKDAVLFANYFRGVNTGSLGGTLSKAGDKAREMARAGRAAGIAAGEAAAGATYEAGSRNLPDGAGTGGGAPPSANSGGQGETGRPRSSGSGGRYNPAFDRYVPEDQRGR